MSKICYRFVGKHSVYRQGRNGTSRQWVPPKSCLISTRQHFLLHRYFTKWKLRLNDPTTEMIIFSKHHPPLPNSIQIHGTFALGLRHTIFRPCFKHKLLYTEHLRTVTNKTTDLLCDIFALLARGDRISQKTKLTPYTFDHPIHSHLPSACLELYTTPTTSNSKQSKTRAYE